MKFDCDTIFEYFYCSRFHKVCGDSCYISASRGKLNARSVQSGAFCNMGSCLAPCQLFGTHDVLVNYVCFSSVTISWNPSEETIPMSLKYLHINLVNLLVMAFLKASSIETCCSWLYWIALCQTPNAGSLLFFWVCRFVLVTSCFC